MQVFLSKFDLNITRYLKINLKVFFFFTKISKRIKIPRAKVDYTVKRHQEMGQNKTESRAGRPKATRGQFYQSLQLAWQKTNYSWYYCTTEPMSWKNLSTSTVRRRLSEAALYGRIAIKNTFEEAKQCQKAPVNQGTQKLNNRAVK